MTHDDLTSKMADYLGDELNDAERLEFEEQMRSDPELQAKVEGLRRTISTLRQVDAPVATDASHYTPDSQAPTSAASTRSVNGWSGGIRGIRGIRGIWRYAAVMAIAFVGGLLARGGPQQQASVSRDQQTVHDNDGNVDSDGKSSGEDSWRNRFLRQYGEHGSNSGLGRSLIALARSGR